MARVGVLIGSLSKDSYSRKVADYFTALPTSLEFVELNYSILPFYNPDLEKKPPIEWQAFRKATDSVDALLIVTQEYNYSRGIEKRIRCSFSSFAQSAFDGKASISND